MINTNQRNCWNTIHILLSRLLLALLVLSAPKILAQEPATVGADEPDAVQVSAQEPEQEQNQGQAQGQQQSRQPQATERVITIEEITVTAERSFLLLRSQIDTAARALYSTYNDLNENDDLDVVCERRARPGYAHIREQHCWPKFFTQLVAENSQNSLFLNQNTVVIPVNQLANQYRKELDAVKTNMLRLANEHPSVADAIMEMGKLEQALKDKEEECRQQPAFLGLLRYCP